MYVFNNPVLQRELLVNLRMPRAFVLLFLYQSLLAVVVFFAWPRQERLDLTGDPLAARQLVDLFFIGQYLLASMMAPSFAAGAITGEKERKTYEMLLASPLEPQAIVLGKLAAALAHLGALIFGSLPIVMLCLPLGGVSLYEVLAAYLGLIVSVATFGMISVACSSYFKRTAAALAVSYLLILPLALIAVLLWRQLSGQGETRLLLTITWLPTLAVALGVVLFVNTSNRLLHPPDVGSEGKEVVDLDEEAKTAVLLVIRRDQFPDNMLAPAKRETLMEDGINPIYDKEIRSEIFSQGTLMLRVVIQVSMVLAIPFMAICLYVYPQLAPWYMSYVLLFNMLVGPVFSAGSVSGERERQTLDLLLTTVISPWSILWGKFLAGLRVSSVLTGFLLWPLLLACVMVWVYWSNLPTVGAYLLIIAGSCVSTAMIALFCSVIFRKTSVSLIVTYLAVILLYCAPLAAGFFADTFFPQRHTPATLKAALALRAEGRSLEEIARKLTGDRTRARQGDSNWTADEARELFELADAHAWVRRLSVTSPFVAAFAAPLRNTTALERDPAELDWWGDWLRVAAHLALVASLNGGLLAIMLWLFKRRWRVAGLGN